MTFFALMGILLSDSVGSGQDILKDWLHVKNPVPVVNAGTGIVDHPAVPPGLTLARPLNTVPSYGNL